MSLEYAPRGLVGMLTPQANTTVEPEFNLLWPSGVAMINARLLSDKPTIAARLVDYFASYGTALDQFANAPIRVVGAACTGASYLAGRECEAARVAEVSARYSYPFITAALAVVDALKTMQAERIALVSPYPDDLNTASVAYWQSHGFAVEVVARAFNTATAFHPIYSLEGAAAARALRELEDAPVDAVVMLGTGMPTLRPLRDVRGWRGAPALSCNLCLAWRMVEVLDGAALRADTLRRWIDGEPWAARLDG